MSIQINPSKINWDSNESILLFNKNPSITDTLLSAVAHLPNLSAHVWLMTSGSSCLKLVALSKKALLHSALSVNQHLSVSNQDRWGICLPLFHVGGLSILARAHLSSSAVSYFRSKWSASTFVTFLKQNQITLSSLVPTQVYDLVLEKQSAPSSLRAVVIGGSALSQSLYHAARALGWPLLPSYGLTECSSQVATAELQSLKENTFPRLKILSHVQIKISKPSFGEIGLQSGSLLTGFVFLSGPKQFTFQRFREGEWYWTKDQGITTDQFLEISSSGHLKILGERISLNRLEDDLMNILLKYKVSHFCRLVAVPHLRNGFQITLVTDSYSFQTLYRIIQDFNQLHSGFEKIQTLYIMPFVPVSNISKPLYANLLESLAFFNIESLSTH